MDSEPLESVATQRGISRRRFFAAAAGTLAACSALTPAAEAASATPAGGTSVSVRRLERGVLLIEIDRPAVHNLIDVPTFIALGRAYFQFERDEALRVAVLAGRGADFSRGLDPPSWIAALGTGQFNPNTNDFINPLGTAGPRRTKPVVVAVQGATWRIAHELFLAADVRIAANDTLFSQSEAARASYPAGGATVRFVREAGWGNAMRYMLTGDEWRADEAYRLGLVQEVVPVGRQLDRAIELAAKIAAAAPLGVRAVLTSARRAQTEGEEVAYAALLPEFARLFGTEDNREFRRSIEEHRPPVYRGR